MQRVHVRPTSSPDWGGPIDGPDWEILAADGQRLVPSVLNVIIFPAGILQPPAFDPNADMAINYGAAGGVIGHELTHGFDDQGRKIDADGNIPRLVAAGRRQDLRDPGQGLADQYSAFEPLAGVHVNGALTLGENIADLGGVTLALDAYRASLQGRPRRCSTGSPAMDEGVRPDHAAPPPRPASRSGEPACHDVIACPRARSRHDLRNWGRTARSGSTRSRMALVSVEVGDLARRQGVDHVCTWPGAAVYDGSQPVSVRRAFVARRSSGQGNRSSRPRLSRRATTCERRAIRARARGQRRHPQRAGLRLGQHREHPVLEVREVGVAPQLRLEDAGQQHHRSETDPGGPLVLRYCTSVCTPTHLLARLSITP